jgi:hypothetical protein
MSGQIRKLKLLLCLLILFICIEFLACKNTIKKDTSIKSWILNNQRRLIYDMDTIFRRVEKSNNLDKNWTSFSIVIVNSNHADINHSDDSLESLLKKAGDSSKCIVIELDFYRDSTKKRRIMIAAKDSTCLKKLRMFELDTDSTSDFVFGKLDTPLY